MKRFVDAETKKAIAALRKSGLARVKCVGCGVWLEAYQRDDEWFADVKNNPHGAKPTRFSCPTCKVTGALVAPLPEPEDRPS